MNKKALTISIMSLGVFASLLGSAKAYSSFKQKAKDLEMHIGASLPTMHNVKYYLPDISDTTHKNFIEGNIAVREGTNLYNALQDYAVEINLFSFVNWHSSKDHFRNDDPTQDIVPNTTLVTEDMTVFAKYTRQNTLYFWDEATKHNYINATTNDKTIGTNTVYIGDWIYSYDGVDGVSKDLITNSGIYKLENTGDGWNILRKVTFSVSYVSSWWYNASAHTHIYYENISSSGGFKTDVALYDHKVTYYFNYDVNKFVICRSPSSSTDWNQFWNQTFDAFIDQQGVGSTKYSSSSTVLHAEDSPSEGKKNYSWRAE